MNTEHGEILIYQTEDGKTSLNVQLEDETVWMGQAQLVELFGKTKQNFSLHIRNIFKQGELAENSVVKEHLTTASDGKKYYIKFYNLDVIISVGYRVKSQSGTQFRIWATSQLKDHRIKGTPSTRDVWQRKASPRWSRRWPFCLAPLNAMNW
jgi:hypothetical protein